MDYQQGQTFIINNSYDISKARKNMTEVMRTYVQSKECKRKIILNYFDHDVPNSQHPDHTCCDFHREHYQCEDCELVHVADDLEALSVQQEMTVTEQNESYSPTTSITFEAKEKVRQDLEQYRMKLQRDLGRGTVGSTGLCSGFPIKLIALVLQHLPELTSVEKVEAILPMFSKEMAQDFYYVIQKHLPRGDPI